MKKLIQVISKTVGRMVSTGCGISKSSDNFSEDKSKARVETVVDNYNNKIVAIESEEFEHKVIEESNNMKDYFDNANWHFDDSYNGYSKRFDCEGNKENENHIKAVITYAATHIGMYMAWIIKHNLEGDIHKKYSNEDLEKVRNEKMTGVEFLLKNCDGKLLSEDFNKEGIEFTICYYKYYLADYSDLVLCEFDIEYSIYEIDDQWNNYKSVHDMLDKAYINFKQGKVLRIR